MIDYDYADRKYQYLTEKLIISAFRKIALSSCVSSSNIYNSLELDDCLHGIELFENRDDLTEKYRLRLIRVINRLNVSQEQKKKSNAFSEERVYDARLHENMALSYQQVAPLICDEYFQEIPLNTLARSVCLERSEYFSFIECALVICLLLAIRGKSICKINEPVTTANELKRAKPRFRKIKNTLFSENMDTILSSLLFDLLAEHYQKNYQEDLERYLKEFWLPEDKRRLKTTAYAIKRYENKIANEPYNEEQLKKLKPIQRMALYDTNQRIEGIQWFFHTIVPITEAFQDGVLPKNFLDGVYFTDKSKQLNVAERDGITVINMRDFLLASDGVSESMKRHIRNMPLSWYEAAAEDYLVAQRLSKAVSEYIAAVRKSVVNLLETLPEAKVAGEAGLWNYLSNL